jgi:hypothetical protein
MSSQPKGGRSVKGPTQSRLPFARNTSPTHTNDELGPESAAPTCPSSPNLSESNPEASRSSTPQSTVQKTKKKRTAWVFRHMAGSEDMQTVFYNTEELEIWPCRYCQKSGKKKEYLVSGGTANIERHLKTHSVFQNTPMENRLLAQQRSIQEAMVSAEHNPTKKRKLTEETLEEKPLNGATLEALFVRWIAADNQALRLVECPEFRAFLTYLNSNVNVYLTNAHSTCGEWVLNQYKIEKERIQLRLHASCYKIHISLDI